MVCAAAERGWLNRDAALAEADDEPATGAISTKKKKAAEAEVETEAVEAVADEA